MNNLEVRIEALEVQKAPLQADINSSGSDYVRLQTCAEKLHSVEVELQRVLEGWLKLSEIAD